GSSTVSYNSAFVIPFGVGWTVTGQGVPSTYGSGATVKYTVASGAIAAVNATPRLGGSGYPPSATFNLLVSGGGLGNAQVTATTNASGVVTSFATSPASPGTGYTAAGDGIMTSIVPATVSYTVLGGGIAASSVTLPGGGGG